MKGINHLTNMNCGGCVDATGSCTGGLDNEMGLAMEPGWKEVGTVFTRLTG